MAKALWFKKKLDDMDGFQLSILDLAINSEDFEVQEIKATGEIAVFGPLEGTDGTDRDGTTID